MTGRVEELLGMALARLSRSSPWCTSLLSTRKPDERDLEVCRRTGDRAVGRASHNHNSGEPAQHPRSAAGGRLASGDERDDNVGGVAVEVFTSAVVDGGGAKIGVTGGDLDVA
jgi:hypothetical protein